MAPQPVREGNGADIKRCLSRKIPVDGSVFVHRPAEFHSETFRTVVIRSGHVNLYTLFGKPARDGAHRETRSAPQRTNGRDHVQNFHAARALAHSHATFVSSSASARRC